MELGTELIDTSRGEILCDHYTLNDDRIDIDYWIFHGTEFMAKIMTSDATGQSTDQGVVIFDSNRLIETS